MKKPNTETLILIGASVAVLAAAFALYWVVFRSESAEAPSDEVVLEREDGRDVPVPSPAPIEEEPSTPDAGVVLHTVPFTAQAPFGEWTDPRQQDGCEEAASLMAVTWARGETFTLAEAKAEIIAIAEYEQATYGTHNDTSAIDTLTRIIQGYFGYQSARVEYGITKQDIIDALYAGKVVIVPTDGRALQNPNFTDGGPDRHMLIVVGYDPSEDVFITNDNGTRQGKGYRYDEDLFFGAIRDYTTGSHLPIVGRVKAMIAVEAEV
jgi:hypothetical protein